MKKLSFVLPVYNVEDYIEQCIRSIRNTDLALDEYEIIVVNDGSPDNSQAIIQKLKKEISNTYLVNQENAGVSAARNTGLSLAKPSALVG